VLDARITSQHAATGALARPGSARGRLGWRWLSLGLAERQAQAEDEGSLGDGIGEQFHILA